MMARGKEIIVTVGDYQIASNPTVLSCIGLGSCVGIALYDTKNRLGALAHAMLPEYKGGRDKDRPGKYVDTSIYLMVDELVDRGCRKRGLKAKLVGGARMFSFLGADTLDIGKRNLEAAMETLKKEKIRLVAKDVGGTTGRTVYFYITDGRVEVRKNQGKMRVI